MLLQTQNPT